MTNPEKDYLSAFYEEPETGDLGSILRKKILENGGIYTEKVKVNNDGSLDILNLEDDTQALVAPLARGYIEDYFNFVVELEKMFPNLNFNVIRSNVDGTMTLIVKEKTS